MSSSSAASVASVSIKIDAFCPVGIGGTKGIDTTYLKLFVGGLSPQYSSKDLFDLFSKFGTIRESVVIPDRFRVRSRCYGFVTFVNDKAAQSALDSLPIVTQDGAELTVVLASTNTKPRRAHFNVKHGISGHKPLPTVNEEEEHDMEGHLTESAHNSVSAKSGVSVKDGKRGMQAKYVRKSVSNIKLTASTTRGQNKKNQKKNESMGNSKVAIYTDPSLFRTANIQQIAPAVFDIGPQTAKKKKKSVATASWPNDDIKKDYHDLKKVAVSKEQTHSDGKAWKLIASETEPDRESYYDDSSYFNEYCERDDDICSVKSREWTPIASKSRKRRHKRKSPKRKVYHWNGSVSAASTSSMLSAAASCASSAANHDNVKYWQKQENSDDDDRITVTSSVFNAIFDEDMHDDEVNTATNHSQSATQVAQRDMNDTQHKSEAKDAMNAGACSVASSSINNVFYGAIPTMNGVWGSYEPVFAGNVYDYNFQNMAPTPPVLPVAVPNSDACSSVKNFAECPPMYGNSNGNGNVSLSAHGGMPEATNVTTSHCSNSNSFQSYMPMHEPNYLNCFVQPQLTAQAPAFVPSQSYTAPMNNVSNCNMMPMNGNYASVGNMQQSQLIYNNYVYNTPMHQSVSNSK